MNVNNNTTRTSLVLYPAITDVALRSVDNSSKLNNRASENKHTTNYDRCSDNNTLLTYKSCSDNNNIITHDRCSDNNTSPDSRIPVSDNKPLTMSVDESSPNSRIPVSDNKPLTMSVDESSPDSRIPVSDNKPLTMLFEESFHGPAKQAVSDNRRALDSDINSLSDVIELTKYMSHILISSDSIERELSTDIVNMFILNATISLGHDVSYDATTFEKLNLRQFQPAIWESNDQRLLGGTSLDELIQVASAPLRLKGEDANRLRESFRGQSGRHLAIDILSVGQRVCTGPGFKPNGGAETSNSSSYNKMRPICNHAILKMVEKGRAIAISKETLIQTNQMKGLVVNRLTWAKKTGDIEGRTCLDPSTGSIQFPSLNESIDRTRSDLLYPKCVLPMLYDIAELACRQRARHPGKRLSGATVDISSAYNQFPQHTASAKQQAVQLKVDLDGGLCICIIVILLVGMFGHTLAGDVYNQVGKLLHDKHNENEERSATYIDDAAFIDDSDLIDASVDAYKESVRKVFGDNGVINDKKVFIWSDMLIAIGWQFDFLTWTVQPKQLGLDKLMYRLFVLIPVGARTVLRNDLEKLTGTLSWYAAGIPYGKSFISSLFACQRAVGHRIALTVQAQADLTWWRALIVIAHHRPGSLAASIDAVRRDRVPDLFLVSDASSTVGGGAWVALSLEGSPLEPFNENSSIRWSADEIIIFESSGVSINVLEYYVVVYYILLWGNEFRNKIIHVKCDNSSAVSWIVKSRALHSPFADALSKLFSLFCLKMNITLICTHIAGVDNVTADFRSRDLTLLEQDADEGLVRGTVWNANTRKELCRRLLRTAVLKPEELHGLPLLQLLTLLR